VFGLIARLAEVGEAEMWEVFNMGCGFCGVFAPEHADRAVHLLATHHPGTAVIGRVTDRAGVVAVPEAGLELSSGGQGGA
jgi:phosphoribosylformylglycinamidine cyclo-ligase